MDREVWKMMSPSRRLCTWRRRLARRGKAPDRSARIRWRHSALDHARFAPRSFITADRHALPYSSILRPGRPRAPAAVPRRPCEVRPRNPSPAANCSWVAPSRTRWMGRCCSSRRLKDRWSKSSPQADPYVTGGLVTDWKVRRVDHGHRQGRRESPAARAVTRQSRAGQRSRHLQRG